MGKFDLSKFDGVFGVGLFGATISCFIVYLVCSLLAKDPANLLEVTRPIAVLGTSERSYTRGEWITRNLLH